MGVGEGPQQDVVDHGEDGRIGTHPQRQGENREDRDAQAVA